MTNYDELPLFPLHAVLYPEMPLPLHVFEPRYREMIQRCRKEKSPFGVVLIQNGREAGAAVTINAVGTTARITRAEDLPDGRMNILVTGEARFRVLETHDCHSYLTAKVCLLAEDADAAETSRQTASRLFKDYVKTLFLRSGRTLSALQLPQEPRHLSYAVAAFLPIPLAEKQRLLETASVQARLEQEIKILGREMEAQGCLDEALGAQAEGTVVPVDSYALGLLSSRN